MVPHFLLSPSRFRDKNTYKCMPKVNDQFLHNYTVDLHVHVAIFFFTKIAILKKIADPPAGKGYRLGLDEL